MASTVASAALFAALAVGQVWDRGVFLRALCDALSGDPQLIEPPDEAAGAELWVTSGGHR